VLGGRGQSIDGATALRSGCIQAEIAQSVRRGLEWVDKPRGRAAWANRAR
jgi:hypothetical protein